MRAQNKDLQVIRIKQQQECACILRRKFRSLEKSINRVTTLSVSRFGSVRKKARDEFSAEYDRRIAIPLTVVTLDRCSRSS